MNPCAKVRLPNVFQGILVGKAHAVLVFRGGIDGDYRMVKAPSHIHSCTNTDPYSNSYVLESAMMLHMRLACYHASAQAGTQRLACHKSVLSCRTWS